jgi:type III secretion protein S
VNFDVVLRLSSEALMLCVVLSLPAVAASALLGLLISFMQAVLSLQDQSISQGIKLLVVSLVVLLSAPWAAGTLMRFSESLFTAIFSA